MAGQLTELILDRAHNAVISMDQRGVVTYWNPAAETVLGVSREQAVDREVAELIVPERLREAHSSGIRRLVAGGTGRLIDRRVEMPALRSDGSEFPVEMTISASHVGGEWSFTAEYEAAALVLRATGADKALPFAETSSP